MVYFRNILNWLLQPAQNRVTGRSDLRAFLICLVGAASFWFLNSMTLEHTMLESYRVIFQDENGQSLTVPSSSSYLRFNIIGSGWTLLRENLKKKEKTLIYNIDRKNKSKYVVAGNLKNAIVAQLGEGLKIGDILQDTFYVNFEPLISKKVPVIIDSSNIKLGESIRIIDNITVKPAYVLITGAFENINRLDTIFIKIPDQNITKNYNRQLKLPNLINKDIRVEPSSINVSFGVEEFVTKVINQSIEKINFSNHSRFTLDNEEAEIVFVCKSTDIDLIKTEEFKIIADFYKINLEDTTITLSLERVPAGIREAHINNKVIKLKYTP